jgi:cyclopropane-fatty-acyl-phospholipid synthase
MQPPNATKPPQTKPKHHETTELPEVLTSTPVASIERLPGGAGVLVTPAGGKARSFDAVVVATHSDTALGMLGAGATPQEREVLGAIPYNRLVGRSIWLVGQLVGWSVGRLVFQSVGATALLATCLHSGPNHVHPSTHPPVRSNDVYLHTDEALMPRLKKTWSSWNFLGSSGAAAEDSAAVCVTYWLNKLQVGARGQMPDAGRWADVITDAPFLSTI